VAGTEPFKCGRGKIPASKCSAVRVREGADAHRPDSAAELLDLTTYIKSLPPAPRRPKHGRHADAVAGTRKAIFFATKTPGGKEIPHERRCSTCHRPPLYSRGCRLTWAPEECLTRRICWHRRSAPYLHDGRAQTLEELWTTYNTNDLHGGAVT